MINNSFNLIGVCTTEYMNIGNKKFSCYLFRIEVEKYNGGVFELEAYVYSTNKAINLNQSILGKQVALNGFVDTYKVGDELRMKLVCQNLLILNNHTKFVGAPKPKEEPAEKTNTNVEIDSDDLPF